MKTTSFTIVLASVATSLSLISCKTTQPTPTAPKPAHDHSTHSHSQASTPTKSTTTPAPVAKSTSSKVKPYPLKTCIVSDEALESMGGSLSKVYKDQEVKFCCKGCVKDFNAAPEDYLVKLK